MDISRLAVTWKLWPIALASGYAWSKLAEERVLVEATTGNNTGTRLAFIGAVKGCKVILILPASLTDPAKGYWWGSRVVRGDTIGMTACFTKHNDTWPEFKLWTRIVRALLQRKEPSKNRRMPLSAESTRYSLVKGERIVRSVLTARLRIFH